MTGSVFASKMADCVKKIWRSISSPSIILWVLILVLITAVALASYGWRLKPEQILSASVAAAAVPLAFITQQAVLREDKKQQLRLKAYDGLQETIRELSGALSNLAVSSPDEWSKVVTRQTNILKATAKFTNHYHTYEMVFKPIENEFRYIHFSSQRLTNILSTVSMHIDQQRNSVEGYNSGNAKDLLAYQKCKELADDILAYLYDLEKDSMKVLRFDGLFGVIIEDRQPNDRKYKILKQLATKTAVRDLENEVISGVEK